MEETVELAFDASEFKVQKPVKHRNSYYGKLYEYDMDGTFIRSWKSSAEAAEFHGISAHSVYTCVTGGRLYIDKIQRIFLHEEDSIEERLALLNRETSHSNKKAFKVPVDEYDLNGRLKHRYISITEAAEHTNTGNYSVAKCCKGEPLYTKGRIFLFHGDSITTRLELIQQKELGKNMEKSINAYTLKGIFLKAFKSPIEAAEEYGIPPIKVVWCCMGKISFCDRKIFLFSSDNINNRIKKK